MYDLQETLEFGRCDLWCPDWVIVRIALSPRTLRHVEEIAEKALRIFDETVFEHSIQDTFDLGNCEPRLSMSPAFPYHILRISRCHGRTSHYAMLLWQPMLNSKRTARTSPIAVLQSFRLNLLRNGDMAEAERQLIRILPHLSD